MDILFSPCSRCQWTRLDSTAALIISASEGSEEDDDGGGTGTALGVEGEATLFTYSMGGGGLDLVVVVACETAEDATGATCSMDGISLDQ